MILATCRRVRVVDSSLLRGSLSGDIVSNTDIASYIPTGEYFQAVYISEE